MLSFAGRILGFVSLLVFSAVSVAAATQTVDGSDELATGQCTIQLTYLGCQACCETSERVGGILASLCNAATRGSGGLLGGWLGSIAGGLIGDLLCEPMMLDSNCYDRCIGKDGDPTPILCYDPADPEELGVCRQVCEHGQHNIGTAGCPTNSSIALACCINEYDPPDDECPDGLCPGPLCPPECDNVLY